MRAFKKNVMRISGPNIGKVTQRWRKPHNELHNLYSSPSILSVIKSRVMRDV
jgi:hypothetical protein